MKSVEEMSLEELEDDRWQCDHDLAIAGSHEAMRSFRIERIGKLKAIRAELARRAGEGQPCVSNSGN